MSDDPKTTLYFVNKDGTVAGKIVNLAPADEEHWICPCNYMNKGVVCTHCGRPRSKNDE